MDIQWVFVYSAIAITVCIGMFVHAEIKNQK